MKCFPYLFLGLSVLSPGILVAESGASPQLSAPTPPTIRPNVLIILTDDQGYGDMGAHGHPFLKTPNMDKMHAESVRFTDFHVAPMCSPTRGELMTGVDAMKNGCTFVNTGRSMVREDIPMLANYFGDAGYATGLFGKWHMGDSYPYRPQDRGFQEVLTFRGWGLSANAGSWESSPLNLARKVDVYTDPMLEHNGVDTLYPGFSGDIWFTEAMKFMEKCKQENKPFFVYLPDNLAHVPDCVPKKYSEPYAAMKTWKGTDGKDVKVPAAYYGQIANIDENMGRLEEFLVKSGLKDNTIVIFSSDNGTRSKEASEIYNGGMRGHKTEFTEGGHRVHCFFRWPQSGIKHGRDITELTEVQDIAPTLLDLCGINPANRYPMDGVSWAALLNNLPWPHADRKLAVQYGVLGRQWDAAVASLKWRLMDKGSSLHDMTKDPHQDTNVAAQNPEVLKALNTYYDEWYKAVSATYKNPRYIHIGHPGVPEVIMYPGDWQGDSNDTPFGLEKGATRGIWDIEVETAGNYRVELSRWPFESGKALIEGVDPGSTTGRGARPIVRATLQIGKTGQVQSVTTTPDQKTVSFDITLPAGKTTLDAQFLGADGKLLCSAFYVKVKQLK
jgi:arylsulfatase